MPERPQSEPAPLLRLPLRVALWQVAWPMVAIGWLRTLNLLADAYWVGDLGARELEALAGASFAAWMLDHVGELGATGVHARVARAVGAGQAARIPAIVASGAAVSAVLWCGLALLSGPLVGWYVHALGLSEALSVPTASFLTASLAAAPGLFALALVGGVFRGLGRTRDALWVTGAALGLNAVLDPWFIFGGAGLPAMGLAGAAWATGAASAVCGVLGAWWLARDAAIGWARPSWAGMAEVARIGTPIAATGVGFAAVYVVLGRLISGFGGAELAAIGIGHRLEGVPYLAGVGLAVGVSTLVGQHLGAGDADGAARVVRAATRVSDVLMVGSGLVAMGFAEAIYGLFTDDPAILAAGGIYLRIQALVWVGMGRELLFEGAFTGSGRTLPAMVWGGGLTFARVPAAWALVGLAGLGVEGVWIAIAASTAGKGMALGWRWSRGAWRTAVGDDPVQDGTQWHE